jgi:putative transposase
MVAAAIRTIPESGFAQPDAEHVHEQFEVIAAMLAGSCPRSNAWSATGLDDTRLHRLPGRALEKIWLTSPSGCTKKSIAAPTWSESSPTPPPCSDWPARSWSRPASNGSSPPMVATSQNAPWSS